jgi:hypothetical protein
MRVNVRAHSTAARFTLDTGRQLFQVPNVLLVPDDLYRQAQRRGFELPMPAFKSNGIGITRGRWSVRGVRCDQIKAWLEQGLIAVKVHELLARQGVVVPERTMPSVERRSAAALRQARRSRRCVLRRKSLRSASSIHTKPVAPSSISSGPRSAGGGPGASLGVPHLVPV